MSIKVYTLYRVSTGKQVDYDDKSRADIPMQRKACHRFAEQKGWDIIHEEQEEGVSGHKIRAAKRDKLQIIKEHALQGKFDILLVFMFDRIGRISDETPFIVEWFVKHGIRVWSTQEGEQRFDNHTDKLINYIRFWQADGESEKTSIRTKTSLGQMVEDGYYKGGNPAYGYELVKSGRINKRKHECFNLSKNESEAVVVRIIFEKYVFEGYGDHRIATHLNKEGHFTRKGKCWHSSSIRGILCNLTYTGVLRSGESRSEVLEYLKIIDCDMYQKAQEIRKARSKYADEMRTTPLNTRGNALLAGNVFCGHCGSRLTLTTNGRYRPLKDGTYDKTKRVRYVCYGKTRKQTNCNGQTGYTQTHLDNTIEAVIKRLFNKMKNISKGEAIDFAYQSKMVEKKAVLSQFHNSYMKAQREVDDLKQEVIKTIQGDSKFSPELLNQLITEADKKCNAVHILYTNAQAEYEKDRELLEAVKDKYDEIMSWTELYDSAPIEAKKMIVSQLIKKINVFSGYDFEIEFNIDLEQFNIGIDELNQVS